MRTKNAQLRAFSKKLTLTNLTGRDVWRRGKDYSVLSHLTPAGPVSLRSPVRHGIAVSSN